MIYNSIMINLKIDLKVILGIIDEYDLLDDFIDFLKCLININPD